MSRLDSWKDLGRGLILEKADYKTFFSFSGQHVSYCKTRLITMGIMGNIDNDKQVDSDRVEIFVREFLRRDGIFLIYLISNNASDLIASEVVLGLWQNYWGPKVQSKYIKNIDETVPTLNIKP